MAMKMKLVFESLADLLTEYMKIKKVESNPIVKEELNKKETKINRTEFKDEMHEEICKKRSERKRKKQIVDPDAPKKPLPAYILFHMDRAKQLRQIKESNYIIMIVKINDETQKIIIKKTWKELTQAEHQVSKHIIIVLEEYGRQRMGKL